MVSPWHRHRIPHHRRQHHRHRHRHHRCHGRCHHHRQCQNHHQRRQRHPSSGRGMPQAAPLNHCRDDDDRIVRIVVLVIIITTVVSIIIILLRSMRSWHSVQFSQAKLYNAEKAHVREPPKAGSTQKSAAPNTSLIKPLYQTPQRESHLNP